jgi:hypothetical protein
VNDGDARYPVTIDPISSSPDRLLIGPLAAVNSASPWAQPVI